MGVGKTTISKKLYESLENSFWLDGDNCCMIHPFDISDENKRMVEDNIIYILNNFIKNSYSKYIVFNWVIPTDEVMNDILEGIKNKEDLDIYKLTLTTTKEELMKRIGKDIGLGLRKINNLKKSVEMYALFDRMDTIKMDTTNKSVEEIVSEIKDLINK